jgi:hypothetical protein
MRLLKHLDHKKIACDVDEELRFHVEMLQQKYTRQGMSPAEAKAAAQKRFGNFERVKVQCVQISKRTSPLQHVLKTLAIILGCSGLLIWVLSVDYKVARIGTVLISIAILGRLLLYVRGLTSATFLPRTKEASPSITRNPECL